MSKESKEFNGLNDSKEPKLIEYGVTYFLDKTLKKCHRTKESHRFFSNNIAALCCFTIAMSSFLIYKYKGKKTLQQSREENIATEKFIMSQIYKLQTHNHENHPTLITTLPQWESEFDILHRKLSQKKI
jgi:hypothetical protein